MDDCLLGGKILNMRDWVAIRARGIFKIPSANCHTGANPHRLQRGGLGIVGMPNNVEALQHVKLSLTNG